MVLSQSLGYLWADVISLSFWVLSIQQKFRFEISEISRAQWNGTFWLHRPDPRHWAFDYCSCKQDTTERYWGQQFCQMERDISDRPKWPDRQDDHLQCWFRRFLSDQTEKVRHHLMYKPKYPEFWVEWKAPSDSVLPSPPRFYLPSETKKDLDLRLV